MEDILKGFKDYTGEEAQKRAFVQKVLVETFERYGFEPAETPIIEYEEFVRGSQEQAQDEVISDIYKLQDKAKRKLALRYEFTFQIKRLMKNKKLPYKRYQIGPVFRDEPISKNRLRQFVQCDADIISSTIKDEAELLSMAVEIAKKLKIEPVILVNNRKLLSEILEKEQIKKKNRQKVLTEIDKYGKLPESEIKKNLDGLGAGNLLNQLKKNESYFKQFKSYKEILDLIKYCRLFGVKVLFSPTIVRGLGYYNGTVFEVKAKGVKETIIAGGAFKIDNIQSFGISFGLDRITALSKIEDKKEKYLVVSLGQDKEAISTLQRLREKNKAVGIYYGKPSKALQYANSYDFNKVIMIGENEVKKKKIKVKDMKSGKESVMGI